MVKVVPTSLPVQYPGPWFPLELLPLDRSGDHDAGDEDRYGGIPDRERRLLQLREWLYRDTSMVPLGGIR